MTDYIFPVIIQYNQKKKNLKIRYKGGSFDKLNKSKEIVNFLQKLRDLRKSTWGCFKPSHMILVKKERLQKLENRLEKEIGDSYLLINKSPGDDKIPFYKIAYELLEKVNGDLVEVPFDNDGFSCKSDNEYPIFEGNELRSAIFKVINKEDKRVSNIPLFRV